MKINERLGVPDGLTAESKRIHEILQKEIRNIQIPDYKEGQDMAEIFRFDIDFGGLKMEDIPFVITFEYFPDVDSEPQLISAAYAGRSSVFHHDKKIRLKSEFDGTYFLLKLACGEKLTKQDIISEVDSKVTSSMISHELMHLYDHYKTRSFGIKKNIDYSSFQSVQFPGPLRRLLFLLYFTSDFENSVRPSELYQSIVDSGITKNEFVNFLNESEVGKMLKSAKNFSLSELKKQLDKDPKTKELVEDAKSSGYQSVGSISDDALNLLFVNIVNTALDSSKEIIDLFLNTQAQKNPTNIFFQMIGIKPDVDVESRKIAQENFDRIVKSYIKYEKNPQKYFEMLEKRLNFVGDKMIKKLAKLYDMTPDTKTQESIINWNLHQELLKKRGTPIHITINFDKFKP